MSTPATPPPVRRWSPRDGQAGVALLTILLLVVVATVLATQMLTRQQRLLRQAQVLLRQDQAMQYALGGEAFLQALLGQDEKASPANDHLGEVWAQALPPFPVEDGMVQGRLRDESGCFDLNSLHHNQAVDPVARQIFTQLIRQADLDGTLTDAVIDWQDPDDATSGPGGAENSFYGGQQPARRAPNQPFASVAELQAVRGFDNPATFKRLAPFLCALPVRTPINVNTAPVAVLTALDENTDSVAIAQWVQQRDRGQDTVRDVSSLWGMAGFNRITPDRQKLLQPLLGVRSAFYRAEIHATFDSRPLYLTSHLFRQGAQVSVYRRSWLPIPPQDHQTAPALARAADRPIP